MYISTNRNVMLEVSVIICQVVEICHTVLLESPHILIMMLYGLRYSCISSLVELIGCLCFFT